MNASRTFWLLLVVLGLGGYIWFYELHQMSTQERATLERQAFDLPVDQIVGIGIQTRSYQVDIKKTEQGWELLHPKGARAGTPVVQQLLARFKNLGKGELITPADMRERELTLADFGLPVPQLILRLETAGESREYHVGDPNPLGNAVYVKENASQNVMLISSDLLDVLPADVAAYRDKTLFPLHFEEVQALDFIDANRTLRLEKREGIWLFKEPLNAKGDQEKIEDMIRKLLQARIDGVVNDPSEEELAGFDGREQVLRVWSANSKVPVEVVVGGDLPRDPDFCFLRITGQEGLVVVSKGMRNLAQTPVAALRDRRLFAMDPQAVQSIALNRGAETLRLEKKENEWWVVDPVNMKASSLRVQNMIEIWLNARVEHFVAWEPLPVPPLMTVSFGHFSGEEKREIAFDILEEGATPGRVWLHKQGDSEKLLTVPDLVKYAPVDVLPYLSKNVLRFEPNQVVRLSLSHGEKTDTVSRAGADQPWTAQTETGVVDQDRIADILDTFSQLTAKNLLSLKRGGFNAYGLEQPAIRLSIGLAGEETGNRTLLLHQQESEDEQPVYGMVQGQPLIFEIGVEEYNRLKTPLGSVE